MKPNEIHPSIKTLNRVFTNAVLSKCRNKKVLLLLSGGLDTRAVLSILLNDNINFDAFTYRSTRKDMRIARAITEKYEINQIIDNRCKAEIFKDRNAKIFEDVFSDYDIVLNSTFLWTFDKYTHSEYSEKGLDEKLVNMMEIRGGHLKKKYPNIFFPGLEKETKKAVDDIPIFYRVMRYPQICIIRLNKPDLMRYPYTSFNLKFRIGLYCHRFALGFMEGKWRF